VAAQGVQRLTLVQLAGDAGALRGVGAVDKQEVGAHDPAVVAERRRERRLWCRVLQPSDEQARRDPAALERSGRAEQVVVLLADPLRSRTGAQHRVDGQAGGRAEAIQEQVAGVAEAWDEPQAEKVEEREDELNSYVDSCFGSAHEMQGRRAGEEPRRGDDFVRRAAQDGRGQRPREWSMRVRRTTGQGAGELAVELVDDVSEPIVVVSSFLRHLAARGCSPNTIEAYAYDLAHFWRYLAARELSWQEFRPAHALELLEALRATPSRRRVQRLGLSVATTVAGRPAIRLAPATVNRTLAAVSSFYEYAVLSGRLERENPIERHADHASERVSDRHRPFMDGASCQRPVRRAVRVKTVQAVPRPLDDAQVAALLGALRGRRDRALILLMLDGGLRPGEALGVCLEDIAYGRRRLVVRCRDDHPKGVRSKSRRERIVDLYEPATLAAVSDYVMSERPCDAQSPYRPGVVCGGATRSRARCLRARSPCR
jgi:site-specific recombinase XerD